MRPLFAITLNFKLNGNQYGVLSDHSSISSSYSMHCYNFLMKSLYESKLYEMLVTCSQIQMLPQNIPCKSCIFVVRSPCRQGCT